MFDHFCGPEVLISLKLCVNRTLWMDITTYITETRSAIKSKDKPNYKYVGLVNR